MAVMATSILKCHVGILQHGHGFSGRSRSFGSSAAALEGTGQFEAKWPGCPHRKHRRAALARAFGSADFMGAG